MISTALHTPRRAPRAVPFVTALSSWDARTAIVADGVAVTYAELAQRVEDRAAVLGDTRRLVMIQGGNTPDVLVTYLAALRGGHVAWLVPDGDPDAGRALRDAFDPDVVVRSDPRGVEQLRVGTSHVLHPDLTLLMGTSGSTGAPRLVRLSHRNLQSNAEAIAEVLGITANDRALTTLPLHYCYGLSVVHSHLLRGATLLLTDRSVTDPALWDLARAEGATSFAGVPHTFELLRRAGSPDLHVPSLRYVTQAGGRMAPDQVRRVADAGARRGRRLFVMYGQTEATARMAYLPPHLAHARPQAVGVPIPGGRITLHPVSEASEPGVGEVVYEGPNVMLGYARHRDDLARGRDVHALRTGDLGRRGPDGMLEIVGRRSRFLKVLGLRVDLGEVERILERMDVHALCGGTDEHLVVAVVGDAPPPGLARVLAGRLGLPAARITVRHTERAPLLPNGKPDYASLAEEPPDTAVDRPAAGDATARVSAAFREVLDRAAVGADDTFAGLGGDSLSYVEMSLALEEVIGDLPSGWPEMTVAQLAACARPKRRGTRVETNVVLRAVAVMLVVGAHMTGFWPLGGAHLLLALAGFSVARFQLSPGSTTRTLRRWGASIARIAVPACAWIGLQAVLAGGYSLGAVLLVNNYTGAAHHNDNRWHYWFIETLVQILVVVGLLLTVPAIRRMERRRPFAFVLVLLATALTFRFDLLTIGGDENRIYRPHTVLWLFLLGWLVQRADTPARRVVASAAILAAVPFSFGEAEREAIITGGLLLLLWVPVLTVPRPAARALGAVAAASLWIYLTHWQAWPAIELVVNEDVSVPLTIMAGVGAWAVAGHVERAAIRVWPWVRRARPRRVPGAFPARREAVTDTAG